MSKFNESDFDDGFIFGYKDGWRQCFEFVKNVLRNSNIDWTAMKEQSEEELKSNARAL